MDENNQTNFKLSLNTKQYENRIVILIDILGFKNFIQNKSCEEVLNFYERIEKLVHEGEIIKEGNVYGLQPSVTFFSDTIFISIPLEIFEKSHPREFLPKFAWFQIVLSYLQIKVSEIQIHALKFGLLTRGGISFGKVYHQGIKWFGEAINEAYEYESKYAIYPRVLLTPSIIEILQINELIRDQEKNPERYSSQALHIGDDGLYSINYLVWIHMHGGEYDTEYAKLKKCIENNLQDKKLLRNDKIKWSWLAKYFNFLTSKLNKTTHKNIAEITLFNQ